MTSINPFDINEEIAKHDEHMTREDQQARELGAFLSRLDLSEPGRAHLPASLLHRPTEPNERDRSEEPDEGG